MSNRVAMWFQVERRHLGDIWHNIGRPYGTQEEAARYRWERLKAEPNLPYSSLRITMTTVEVVYEVPAEESDIYNMSDSPDLSA